MHLDGDTDVDPGIALLLGLAVALALLVTGRAVRLQSPSPPSPAPEVVTPRHRQLRPDETQRFRRAWRAVQALAASRPAAAVADADRLLAEIVRARGLDAVQLASITARVREHQDAAHRVALLSQRGQATHDDLRDALEHYRAIFDELLAEQRAKIA